MRRRASRCLFMAAHDDWIRGTVFSGRRQIGVHGRPRHDGEDDRSGHGSVSWATSTTHTPGVLRGGMLAIDRHPKRNEILVGGTTGRPKLFKMDVKAATAGGGNPNQIRQYEALPGRVFDVRFNPGGTRALAVSSLDNQGHARLRNRYRQAAWQFDVAKAACMQWPARTAAPDRGRGGSRRASPPDRCGRWKLRKSFLPVDITPAGARGAIGLRGPISRTAHRRCAALAAGHTPSCNWTCSRRRFAWSIPPTMCNSC